MYFNTGIRRGPPLLDPAIGAARAERDTSIILRGSLKVIELSHSLNYSVIGKRYPNATHPPPLVNLSLFVGPGQGRHFENFTAILKFRRVNTFVELPCNLANVFEGGPRNKSRPIELDRAKRDISRILSRSLNFIGLIHLRNYSII